MQTNETRSARITQESSVRPNRTGGLPRRSTHTIRGGRITSSGRSSAGELHSAQNPEAPGESNGRRETRTRPGRSPPAASVLQTFSRRLQNGFDPEKRTEAWDLRPCAPRGDGVDTGARAVLPSDCRATGRPLVVSAWA